MLHKVDPLVKIVVHLRLVAFNGTCSKLLQLRWFAFFSIRRWKWNCPEFPELCKTLKHAHDLIVNDSLVHIILIRKNLLSFSADVFKAFSESNQIPMDKKKYKFVLVENWLCLEFICSIVCIVCTVCAFLVYMEYLWKIELICAVVIIVK